ncbi:MAG: thioredoxin family protein [Kofleriaceae bacterium]|nr:thioredoxin family protein [Kofleriaceae bacterium]
MLLQLSSCGQDAVTTQENLSKVAVATVAPAPSAVAVPATEAKPAQAPTASASEQETKVARFFELISEKAEAGVKKTCKTKFKTQAEGGVALIQNSMTSPWQPHLAAVGLSHSELIAFASANPAFARQQMKLSEKRQEAFLETMNESCFKPMAKLPTGDMDAADEAMMQLLQKTGNRPGPLDGVNLEVQHWERDLEKGLELAAKTKRPVLLFFDATWCAPCKVISELFQTQKLIDSIGDSFVRISIDVSDGSDAVEEIQARFAATALPSLLVLDHKGVETARYTKMEATEAGLIAFLKSAKE